MKPLSVASAALIVIALLVVALAVYSTRSQGGVTLRQDVAVATAEVTATAPCAEGPECGSGTPVATGTATPPDSPLPTPVATFVSPYVFGEPQVVLTSTYFVRLGEWLPDGQTLAVSVENTEPELLNFEEIQTLNPVTGEKQIFGRRLMNNFPDNSPDWLTDVQKMAFTGANTRCGDDSCPWTDLWITQAGTTELATPFLQNVTAIAGRGQKVLAIRRDEPLPVLIDAASGEQSIVPIDLSTYGMDINAYQIQAMWHPTVPQVAVFDAHTFLLLNLDTSQVEQVDLGVGLFGDPLWAFDARWSLNGEWIAIVAAEGNPYAIRPYTKLKLINTSTYQLTDLDIGFQYVTDVAWSPDSATMAVMTIVGEHAYGFQEYGLFITNLEGAVSQRVFGEHILAGNFHATLRWSPDGRFLAVLCPRLVETDPVTGEAALCISSVSETGS